MDEEPGTDQIGEQPVGEQPVGDQPGPILTAGEETNQTLPSPTPPDPTPSAEPPIQTVPDLTVPDSQPATGGFEPPAITPSDQAPSDQTPPSQSVSPVHPQSSFPASSDEAPKGFNWGAFWLTWLWSTGHGIWWTLLLIIPIGVLMSLVATGALLPIIINAIFHTTLTKSLVWLTWGIAVLLFFSVNIWFGLKGNSWAWKEKKDLGLEAFIHGEKVWSIVAWIISGIPTIIGTVITVISLIAVGPDKMVSTLCAGGGSLKVLGVEQCNQNTTISSSVSETTPSVSTATETPLGTTVQAGNFTVKVDSVNSKPTITGDAPDSGTEYLEVFVTITNSGKEKDNISAGEFYYQTAAGKELSTADTMGTDSPNKNINLSGGDRRLSVEFLDPGAAATNKALIFQIPAGDSGKLIWHESMFDSSAKLGIFLLK